MKNELPFGVTHLFLIIDYMRTSLLLLSLVLGQHCYSQTKINAKILSKSNKGMPYVSVLVKGSNIGSITNSDGCFELSIPRNKKNANITVSCIGYETRVFPIDSLLDKKNLELHLLKKSYQIGEITINKQLILKDPYKIVTKSISDLPNTLANKPHNYKAFYRQTHSNDSSLTRLIESAVSIYDPGVPEPTFDIKVNIDQIKTSLDSREFDYKFLLSYYEYLVKKKDISNSINVDHDLNNAKFREKLIHHYDSTRSSLLKYIQKASMIRAYKHEKLKRYRGLSPNFVKDHSLILDSIQNYNDEAVYKIKILPHKKKHIHKGWGASLIPLGNIYIRVKDFAILELDYSLVQNPRSKHQSIRSMTGTGIFYKTTIKYREFEGKMHPYYQSSMQNDFNNLIKSFNKEKEHYFIKKELMITEIISDPLVISDENKKLKWNFDLYRKQPVDSNYWENHSIIMETEKELHLKLELQNKKKNSN